MHRLILVCALLLLADLNTAYCQNIDEERPIEKLPTDSPALDSVSQEVMSRCKKEGIGFGEFMDCECTAHVIHNIRLKEGPDTRVEDIMRVSVMQAMTGEHPLNKCASAEQAFSYMYDRCISFSEKFPEDYTKQPGYCECAAEKFASHKTIKPNGSLQLDAMTECRG